MLRFTNSLFLAVACLTLAACMGPPDCFRADIFCAALVTDTLGMHDNGMNQNTWQGLEEAKANMLADRVEYIESVDSRDYEKNIAYFARQGFDMIVTTNPGLRDETLHAADLYPDSVFVGMNQPQTESRSNLVPVSFAEDQMGFAAGALAAQISQTGTVGAVCETSGIDSMWRYCEGFRAGATVLDARFKTLVVYREDGDSELLFLDEAWGYETAKSLIKRGADVIFAAGGLTGQGALRAAAEMNIPAIGAERDQAAALAESGSSVVTSIFGNASFEVQEVMRMLKGKDVRQARSGQIRTVPFRGDFPENLEKEMNLLLFNLWNGNLDTNISPEKP